MTQSSRDEIIALINQLFVIAEDIPRKIRGNSNGSTRAVFQTTRTFLTGDGPGRQKSIFLKTLSYILDHWVLSGTILQICFLCHDGPYVGE